MNTNPHSDDNTVRRSLEQTLARLGVRDVVVHAPDTDQPALPVDVVQQIIDRLNELPEPESHR